MDGLDEMKVESRLAGLLLVGGEPVAGNRDQAELIAVSGGPDAPGDLIPIEPRKANVHERGVGPQPEDKFHPARAVFGLVYFMAVNLEEHAKRLARIGIVFDDDYPPHGDGGSG